MTATVAHARARTSERLIAALLAVAALVGMVVSALPSVLRLVDPPETLVCPAVWPPVTSCAPGAHLVVVGVAIVVLVSAWLVADVLRRATSLPARAGVLAGLAIVALVAWSAARVPQPYFALWSGFFG